LLFTCTDAVTAAETPPRDAAGLANIQLVTELDAVQPGKTFLIGLLVAPEPGHHTYWKAPGIVGVATTQIWTLPPGCVVGETHWPTPSRISMAGITAYGYPDEVLLLTEIAVPADYTGDSVDLKLRVGWMACSAQCNPGIADLELRLPVEAEDAPVRTVAAWHTRFAETLALQPSSAPAEWRLSLQEINDTEFDLVLTLPDLENFAHDGLSFFSYDQQVHSDKEQILTTVSDGSTLRLRLTRTEFAPTDATHLTGLLFCPQGWPGLDSSWVEISVPWHPDTTDLP